MNYAVCKFFSGLILKNPLKNSLGIFRNAQEISMAIAIQSNKKVLKY